MLNSLVMIKNVTQYKTVLVCSVILTLLFKQTEAEPRTSPICCTPDQWEGHVFIDLAQIVFSVFYNISADVSYDQINSRAFINASYVQRSYGVHPFVQTGTVMYIEDYKNNREYEVENQTHCAKNWVDSNMTKTCISVDAKVLSTGIVGKGLKTVTYNMSLGESYPNVRATVEKDSCLPVHMIYIDGVGVTKVDVFNITPGIKDPTIYNVPTQCKHPKRINREEETTGAQEKVKRLVKSHIQRLITNNLFHRTN